MSENNFLYAQGIYLCILHIELVCYKWLSRLMPCMHVDVTCWDSSYAHTQLLVIIVHCTCSQIKSPNPYTHCYIMSQGWFLSQPVALWSINRLSCKITVKNYFI